MTDKIAGVSANFKKARKKTNYANSDVILKNVVKQYKNVLNDKSFNPTRFMNHPFTGLESMSTEGATSWPLQPNTLKVIQTDFSRQAEGILKKKQDYVGNSPDIMMIENIKDENKTEKITFEDINGNNKYDKGEAMMYSIDEENHQLLIFDKNGNQKCDKGDLFYEKTKKGDITEINYQFLNGDKYKIELTNSGRTTYKINSKGEAVFWGDTSIDKKNNNLISYTTSDGKTGTIDLSKKVVDTGGGKADTERMRGFAREYSADILHFINTKGKFFIEDKIMDPYTGEERNYAGGIAYGNRAVLRAKELDWVYNHELMHLIEDNANGVLYKVEEPSPTIEMKGLNEKYTKLVEKLPDYERKVELKYFSEIGEPDSYKEAYVETAKKVMDPFYFYENTFTLLNKFGELIANRPDSENKYFLP